MSGTLITSIKRKFRKFFDMPLYEAGEFARVQNPVMARYTPIIERVFVVVGRELDTGDAYGVKCKDVTSTMVLEGKRYNLTFNVGDYYFCLVTSKAGELICGYIHENYITYV
jgi:hypothetical protein